MDAFADLLDRLDDVALLEFSEGPVHVRVVGLAIELFRLPANVQRLLVYHVDVEQEGEVVVSVRVLVVEKNALFEMLNCVLIVTNFEIGEAQVVVELSVVILDPLSLLKCRDGQNVLILLVHRDAVVKEGLPAACMILLQVALALNCQTVPVLLVQEAETDLLKSYLLFQVECLLALSFIVL